MTAEGRASIDYRPCSREQIVSKSEWRSRSHESSPGSAKRTMARFIKSPGQPVSAVATKELIGTLTVEHDLDSLPGRRAHDAPLRVDPRPRKRLALRANQRRKVLDEATTRRNSLDNPDTEALRSSAGVLTLVEIRLLRAGSEDHLRTLLLELVPTHRHYGRRVDAAAETGTDRHI